MELHMISMGESFKVTNIMYNADDANEVCEKNEKIAVIATEDNGRIYIAEKEPSEWGPPV